MLNQLELYAKGQVVYSLIATISGENPAAMSFHEKAGFTDVGRLPGAGFKFERGMDLILMQKIPNQ